MKNEKIILLKFFGLYIRKLKLKEGYGISYSENKEPYIFVNVRIKSDFRRLKELLPDKFEGLRVEIELVKKSYLLSELAAHFFI